MSPVFNVTPRKQKSGKSDQHTQKLSLPQSAVCSRVHKGAELRHGKDFTQQERRRTASFYFSMKYWNHEIQLNHRCSHMCYFWCDVSCWPYKFILKWSYALTSNPTMSHSESVESYKVLSVERTIQSASWDWKWSSGLQPRTEGIEQYITCVLCFHCSVRPTHWHQRSTVDNYLPTLFHCFWSPDEGANGCKASAFGTVWSFLMSDIKGLQVTSAVSFYYWVYGQSRWPSWCYINMASVQTKVVSTTTFDCFNSII